jgi:hypothetical protein
MGHRQNWNTAERASMGPGLLPAHA